MVAKGYEKSVLVRIPREVKEKIDSLAKPEESAGSYIARLVALAESGGIDVNQQVNNPVSITDETISAIAGKILPDLVARLGDNQPVNTDVNALLTKMESEMKSEISSVNTYVNNQLTEIKQLIEGSRIEPDAIKNQVSDIVNTMLTEKLTEVPPVQKSGSKRSKGSSAGKLPRYKQMAMGKALIEYKDKNGLSNDNLKTIAGFMGDTKAVNAWMNGSEEKKLGPEAYEHNVKKLAEYGIDIEPYLEEALKATKNEQQSEEQTVISETD